MLTQDSLLELIMQASQYFDNKCFFFPLWILSFHVVYLCRPLVITEKASVGTFGANVWNLIPMTLVRYVLWFHYKLWEGNEKIQFVTLRCIWNRQTCGIEKYEKCRFFAYFIGFVVIDLWSELFHVALYSNKQEMHACLYLKASKYIYMLYFQILLIS